MLLGAGVNLAVSAELHYVIGKRAALGAHQLFLFHIANVLCCLNMLSFSLQIVFNINFCQSLVAELWLHANYVLLMPILALES